MAHDLSVLLSNETTKLRERLAKLEQLQLLVREIFGESFSISQSAPQSITRTETAQTAPAPLAQPPLVRTYRVRNIGDAILDVLPTDPTKAMRLAEIHNALKKSNYTYAYESVICGLWSHRSTEDDAFPYRREDGATIRLIKGFPNRYFKVMPNFKP